MARCCRLGLDTRDVRREVTEGSVQAMIAHLGPYLRSSRTYGAGIRPYEEYCEERIDLVE